MSSRESVDEPASFMTKAKALLHRSVWISGILAAISAITFIDGVLGLDKFVLFEFSHNVLDRWRFLLNSFFEKLSSVISLVIGFSPNWNSEEQLTYAAFPFVWTATKFLLGMIEGNITINSIERRIPNFSYNEKSIFPWWTPYLMLLFAMIIQSNVDPYDGQTDAAPATVIIIILGLLASTVVNRPLLLSVVFVVGFLSVMEAGYRVPFLQKSMEKYIGCSDETESCLPSTT